MTWQSPEWLWALLALPLLIAALWAWGRDRAQDAGRYSDLALLAVGADARLRRLRAVAAGLIVLAVACGPVALARPSVGHTAKEGRNAVILALDTSHSMLSTDLPPNRLSAARAAAAHFLDIAPKDTAVGLIVFDRGARVLVGPTTDRTPVRRALADLQVHEGTSIGEAVVAGVALLRAAGVLSPPPASAAESAGRILLITDGANNLGIAPQDAGERARAARVPVYTVLMGNAAANLGQPAPAEAMAALATQTGGTYTVGVTPTDLRRAVEDLGQTLIPVHRLEELTVWLAVIALALLGLAGALLLVGERAQHAPRGSGLGGADGGPAGPLARGH